MGLRLAVRLWLGYARQQRQQEKSEGKGSVSYAKE